MSKPPILLIDDDQAITIALASFLAGKGYPVTSVNDGTEALEKAASAAFPIVISDIYVDRVTGLDVLAAARAANPRCAVVLMTAKGSLGTTVEAEAGGVFEYLAKPIPLPLLLSVVERAGRAVGTSLETGENAQQDEAESSDEMAGSSPAMIALYKNIAGAARSDSTALILGETGAGKERVAQAIHRHSKRASMPFVPVDCAAIAENLWESELFGAVKGAFTGADRDRPGLLRRAEGGTVLLDEIGEIPLSFQSKLLRLLETREFRPVGAAAPIRVDVRMLAATNRKLEEMVRARSFREDLYHRLNVLRVHVPPLRERASDIPQLARRFLRQANLSQGKQVRLNEAALAALEGWPWPGNVRELIHAIERIVAAARSGEASEREVREAIGKTHQGAERAGGQGDTLDRQQVLEAIHLSGGNMTVAAARLGLHRRTLYKKLNRWSEEGHSVPEAHPEVDDPV